MTSKLRFTGLAVGAIAVLLWWGPLLLAVDPGGGFGATTPAVTVPEETSSTIDAEARPTVIVAVAGRYGSQVLRPMGEAFHRTGEIARVRVLARDSQVWALLDDNDIGADVIEIGVRPEALSGAAADRFVPLDSTLVPSLDLIHPALRFGNHGVAVGVTGALGFVVDPATGVRMARSWADLTALTDASTLFLPGPRSPLAAVLVLRLAAALGDPADLEAAVAEYRRLIKAGASTGVSTSDLREALAGGAVTWAVWTTGGVFVLSPAFPSIEFVYPAEGAVLLPAFSGILAGSDHVGAAGRWLEFRLSEPAQLMASANERAFINQPAVLGRSPSNTTVSLPVGTEGAVDLTVHSDDVVGADWSKVVSVMNLLAGEDGE